MFNERTISIIKPDGIYKNLIGAIIHRFEVAGLSVVAIKMLQLTYDQAAGFYCEHKKKVFYKNLIYFMVSGPIVVQVLEGKNAVRRNREIMGFTDPSQALSGTLRSDYADSYTQNIVHGSDSVESAMREISYFFNEDEICNRIFLNQID